MDENFELVMQHPLFEGCNKELLESFVATQMHRLRWRKAGMLLFQKDEKCDYLKLLLKGEVHAMMDDGTQEFIINMFHAPSVIAPYLVYSTQSYYPAYAVTVADSLLLYINPQEFMELLPHDPQLMRNFISLVSSCGQILSRRLYNTTFLTLRQRVVDYLLRYESCESARHLAHYLGVPDPSVSRVLSQLRSDGLVEKQGHTFRLTQNGTPPASTSV